MKLSIIVPIYNVEKFLPRCLDSLLRQGMKVGEWEIICVNDGSHDGCARILENYKQWYPDIFKVITQENKGLGGARNTGIEIARGEWIGFIDPDDYVIDGAYTYILDHFCEESVDVIHFNHISMYTDGKSLYDIDAIPDGKIIDDEDGAVAYNRDSLFYVWSKFYKRSFLEEHRIRFELPFMEDEPFNFSVFLQHPRLRVVTSNIYRYEQGNAQSLMTTTNKSKIKTQLTWLLLVIKKMDCYIHEGNGDIAPAAQRNLSTFCVQYYNKMLKAEFSWHEWRNCVQPIKLQQVKKLDASEESSFMEKLIIHLKNWSGQSYVAYLLVSFFMNTIFTTLIRPRIIESYSKKTITACG